MKLSFLQICSYKPCGHLTLITSVASKLAHISLNSCTPYNSPFVHIFPDSHTGACSHTFINAQIFVMPFNPPSHSISSIPYLCTVLRQTGFAVAGLKLGACCMASWRSPLPFQENIKCHDLLAFMIFWGEGSQTSAFTH